jgi:hypothetical protein
MKKKHKRKRKFPQGIQAEALSVNPDALGTTLVDSETGETEVVLFPGSEKRVVVAHFGLHPATTTIHGQTIELPSRVAARPRDARGYPVLYTTPVKEGVSDFTDLDHNKVMRCGRENLCGICGDPHFVQGQKAVYWFIGGPVSAERTHVYHDPPMHEDCARFAMTVCPWMILARYRRDEPQDEAAALDPHTIYARPPYLCLVVCKSYDFSPERKVFKANFGEIVEKWTPGGGEPDAEDVARYWKEVKGLETRHLVDQTVDRAEKKDAALKRITEIYNANKHKNPKFASLAGTQGPHHEIASASELGPNIVGSIRAKKEKLAADFELLRKYVGPKPLKQVENEGRIELTGPDGEQLPVELVVVEGIPDDTAILVSGPDEEKYEIYGGGRAHGRTAAATLGQYRPRSEEEKNWLGRIAILARTGRHNQALALVRDARDRIAQGSSDVGEAQGPVSEAKEQQEET